MPPFITMKTENPQTKEFRRGIGRARVILSSELGAIVGSPLGTSQGSQVAGVPWLMVPQGPRHQFREITIDAEKLRRMELSLVQLAKHYRPHLAKLVPKPDSWLQRSKFAIDLLKGQLRQPQTARLNPDTNKRFECLLKAFPLPERCKQRAIEIARQHPRLIPLLTAVAFTELTKQEEADFRLLLWIEQHANRLAGLSEGTDSLRIQLALCHLHNDLDSTWLHFLFDVLTDPILSTATNSHPFSKAIQLLNRLLETANQDPVELPIAEDDTLIADQIRTHIFWLVGQSRATIASLSQLLGALVGTDLSVHFISQTLAAEKEERLFERTLQQVLNDAQDSPADFGTSMTEWIEKRRSRLGYLPSGIGELLRLIPLLENHVDHERWRRIKRFFEQLGTLSAYRRIALLDFWMKRQAYYGRYKYSFDQYLPAFAKLFERRTVHPHLRLHWEQTIEVIRGTSHEVVVNQVESDSDRKVMLGVVQLIERLVYDQGLKLPNILIGELPSIVAAAPTLDLAEKFVQRRFELDDETLVSTSNLALAFWLSPSGADVPQCLEALNNDPDLTTAVRAIQAGLSDVNLCDLVRKHACGEHKHLVIRLGASADLLAATNATVDCRESQHTDTNWISYYPIALQDALHKLTTICTNAQRAAAATLSDECRSTDSVQRELGALKRMVVNAELTSEKRARLQQRISNLEARLQTGDLLSPLKQKKLLSKLEYRYDQELVDDFCLRATVAASRKLAEFGFSQLPDRILQLPYSRIIPGIARQTQANREIAFKALAKSCHDTLMLANEPANERYLNSLRNLGINLLPWLSEQISMEGKREDGTAYRVQFTRDPFDIFLMGFHFDTCLSPDSFNFFSTIANLVDANKRVLYGRTDDGQVVGRCLFALTTHGRIQTFHRYCRSKEDGFGELVDQFADKLALAMNTTLTQSGRVPCLVSREWYDDGCESIKSKSAEVFEKVSEALMQCSDSQAYWRALTILGDRQQVVEAIETIVNNILPQRPIIAPSFFYELHAEPKIPALVRLRLAAYGFQAGAKEAALKIFDTIQPATLLKSLGRTKLQELMQDKTVVDLLLAHDPALTRRMMHRSRPNSVRSDIQEFHPVRRDALAKIYHTLNRPTSARLLSV